MADVSAGPRAAAGWRAFFCLGPSPAPGRFLPAILWSFLLLFAACGPSAGQHEASDAVSQKLSRLTFDQVIPLGSHHAESTLVLTSDGRDGHKVIKEEYDLQWDNWNRYRYVVKKGDKLAMDVTVWNEKGYQRQSDGRIKVRNNPEELHYYLRQTWNQLEGALNPFKQVMVYEFVQGDEIEGRPADRYEIHLKRQIDPRPSGTNRLRQSVEHDKLEGTLWLDRTTQVPLQAVVHGEYRLVRFSRRPGKPGEEARYQIDFKLRRYNIGRQQITEPPEAVARP